MSRFIAFTIGVTATLVVVLIVANVNPSRESARSTTTTTIHKRPPPVVLPTTVVSFTIPTAGYSGPGGRQVTMVPSTWLGSPVTVPVVAQRGAYFEVRLPTRPNGSTTWVKRSAVLVSATPYKVIINLSTTHLELLRLGKVILNVPVGVGTTQFPTPTGNFFVAFYATSANYGYGPYVMVTSAHSTKITDWEGSGDALVAIHGPLGADHIIGTTGAQVSHGCVRMHIADQLRLKVVPDGTPIEIIR